MSVTSIVNAATSAAHTAVQLGGYTAVMLAGYAYEATDVLQNPTLNRLTNGQAAKLQAPIQDALMGAIDSAPQAIAAARAGVDILGVTAKHTGWAANNVARALTADDDTVAAEKLALAERQIERAGNKLEQLRDIDVADAAIILE